MFLSLGYPLQAETIELSTQLGCLSSSLDFYLFPQQDDAVLMRTFLQVGFLTTFAILLHEIPHEVRLQSSWLYVRRTEHREHWTLDV